MNNKCFEISISFTVAGDPLAKSVEALAAMETDAIEIGVAFSDPVAESPEVQKANLRALNAGAKNGAVEAALTLAKSLRSGVTGKIVLYSYYNPVFRFGLTRFFERCRDVGVDGVTIPDMPYEERGEALPAAGEYGIALLSTIATTDTVRAERIAGEAAGYLRIEPVGDKKEREAVLAAVKEAASIPYALCELSPEA